jgi:hypothetical protein
VIRCAVIEHNPYHEQVLPTFVHALNALGLVPDVYMPRLAMQADTFAYAKSLRYRLLAADGPSGLRGTPRWTTKYDLLIFNSIEPKKILQKAAGEKRPSIAVVHNADLLVVDPAYASYFHNTTRSPLVLAPHIAASFGLDQLPSVANQLRWVAPVYLGDIPKPPRDEVITLAVQGNVEFVRRNYDSLLDSIEEVIHRNVRVRVIMIGRSDSADGRTLKQEIRRRQLQQWFAFTPELPYSSFLTAIAGCDFILPLIDRSSATYAPYFRFKLTSSLLMSLAIGVPPIVHAEMAGLYGLEKASISYEDGGLTDAIVTAATLARGSARDLVEELALVRDELLSASASNLEGTIADVIGG